MAAVCSANLLDEVLEEISAAKARPKAAVAKPAPLTLPVLKAKSAASHAGLKDQLRAAAGKLRGRFAPREAARARERKLEAPNMKIASPREFNPAPVMHEPPARSWDTLRVDAPERRYPLRSLGRYANHELHDKPPWKARFVFFASRELWVTAPGPGS
ncbi:unnamed protein product [Effrenium voratum]|uniref:Uncharacterized protein n=1 Tax=Effrenium voratum TaxID=2562239 RepID=A0AA36NKT8_9DINO|nr:unnamed protein product [Effrenium voratum]CAJ1455470.1 unnamed protein product [Effrenium voratum]